MIEAALKGKLSPDFNLTEDILTSSAFGLIQYLPLNPFWLRMLNRAKDISGATFIDRCIECGINPDEYDEIELFFWNQYVVYGEPDLVAFFHSKALQRTAAFIIEVKLGSNKSGINENDQLIRYLNLLESNEFKTHHNYKEFINLGVIYLTPRSSIFEVYDSLNHSKNREYHSKKLFHLQWQDIYEVSNENIMFEDINMSYRKMLGKLCSFLEKQGLTYFNGFRRVTLDVDRMKIRRLYNSEYLTRVPMNEIRNIKSLYNSEYFRRGLTGEINNIKSLYGGNIIEGNRS